MFARLSLFAVFLLFFGLNAMASSIDVSAIDTIAGYSSTLKTKQTESNTHIIFRVEKPNGNVVDLSVKSDKNGYAEADLDGYHTKQAGTYKVYVGQVGKDFGSPSSFQVFADVLSPSKSFITGDKASLSAKDILTVQVTLKDKYDNPITGHIIKLLSSRAEDKITTNNQGFSDAHGVATFSVQTSTEGVSIFTAIDQNINQEITNRMKTVFYAPEEKLSFGGNDFLASLTESESSTTPTSNNNTDTYSVLDHFDINFPSTVKVNDDQNHLKVTAKDKSGNTVRSYTGTIKIAVTGDDNAIVPNEGEYTFTEKDQGVKEFALAMVFTTTGSVIVEVFDYDNGQINKNLKGSKTIAVVQQEIDTSPSSTDNSLLVIKAPVNGSELASKTVSVSGMASPNTNLKLLLNDTKVSDISVDSEGFFSATLANLDDGKKEIYIMESEGQRRSSSPVTFTIDATAPRIDTVTLFPKTDIYPETSYTITAISEPKLDYVKVRVNGVENPLTESAVTPGKYEGNFISPKNTGDYNVNIVLADRMGNSQEYQNQLKLTVIEKPLVKPGIPENFTVTAHDSQVTLQWTAPISEIPATAYQVYWGTSQYDLKLLGKTSNTQALITKLTNGKEYFFNISAVSIDGAEGDKSNIITVIPVAQTVATTPTETVHPAAANQPLRAIPGDSKVTLSWNAFDKAQFYKISFGIKSHQYEAFITTKDESTSYVVNDLLNNLPYYFTVTALDKNGFEISSDYSEIKAIPNGFGFNVIPSKAIPQPMVDTKKVKALDQTGPETWIFLALAGLCAGGLFLSTKKKVHVSSASSVRYVQSGNRMQF